MELKDKKLVLVCGARLIGSHTTDHLLASRASERFWFESHVPFEEALRKTIAWYLENRIGK
jgi:hypothetical protein